MRKFLFPITIFLFGFLSGQEVVDSTLLKSYSFRVGNIGFAVDSLEHFVGDAVRGSKMQYQIGMYHFGKQPIKLKAGKVSKLVRMDYEPSRLQPGTEGVANIEVEILREMPLGINQIEIVVESDDPENPFKFLYLVVNIVEDPAENQDRLIIDTVPRLVFDQYNYYFGHLTRAKNVYHTFVFTNRGSKDLIIDEISTSSECSFIPPEETTIPPGNTGSVVVKVRTMGTFGVQHGTVNIMSNDPVNPVITLGMHGTVRVKSPPQKDLDFCLE